MHNYDKVKVAKVINEEVDGNFYKTTFSLKILFDNEYYMHNIIQVEQKISSQKDLELYEVKLCEAREIFENYDPEYDNELLDDLYDELGCEDILDADIIVLEEV